MNNLEKFIGTSLITMLGISAVVAFVPHSDMLIARANTKYYTCASIHFDMDDSTYSSYMRSFNKSSTNYITDDNKENYYTTDSTLTSISFNRCHYYEPNHPIKFGNSDSGSSVSYASITMTFETNIKGFVLWFLPNNAGISYAIKINGSTAKTIYTKNTLTNDNLPTTTKQNLSMLSYDYELPAATNEITIMGNAKTTQLYLACITLRVGN